MSTIDVDGESEKTWRAETVMASAVAKERKGTARKECVRRKCARTLAVGRVRYKGVGSGTHETSERERVIAHLSKCPRDQASSEGART